MNDPYKFTENTTTLTTMAGEPELTGMAKHFNSMTFTGRANVAKATYAAIILTVVAVKAKNKMQGK